MTNKISHVNPNCKDATRCRPHGETGKVTYGEDKSFVEDWEKRFDRWFRKYNPPFSTRSKDVWSAIYSDEEIKSRIDIKSFIKSALKSQKEEINKEWVIICEKAIKENLEREHKRTKIEIIAEIKKKVKKLNVLRHTVSNGGRMENCCKCNKKVYLNEVIEILKNI